MIRAPITCMVAVFVAAFFLAGCSGDPTARFKSFVEDASAQAKADEALTKVYDFEAIEFDVKKTDSTISPYNAQVLITAIDKNAAAEELPSGDDELSAFSREFHDYGDRKYVFLYAYQENKWVLKDTKAEGSGAMGMIMTGTRPPKKLTEYFTP